MKKLIFVFVALIATVSVLLFPTKEVSAANEVVGGVTNLLKKEDFYLNEGDHHLASRTQCRIQSGKNYTMIATKEFFGNNYNEGSLLDAMMGVTIRPDDHSHDGETIRFKMVWRNLGIFSFNFVLGYDAYFEFNDFKVSYNSLSEADLTHVVFYQGILSDFKGFPVEADLSNYEYYGDSNITITTDCTNPISPLEIKNSIVAYDTTDGLISSDQIITVKDTYSENQTVGSHLMEFSAQDAAGNKKTLVVTINVVDSVPPTITLRNQLTWEVRGTIPTLNDLRNNFVVRDNYDGVISVDSLYDLTWTSSITFNGYDTGNYPFSVKCADSSGNIATETFTLRAVDTTPPVIDIAHVEIKLSELGADLGTLNLPDYLAVYNDNSRYIRMLYIESNYQEGDEVNYVGIIPIKVTAVDGAGNITVKEGVVYVVDDIAPSFYIKGSLLQLADDQSEDSASINARIRRSLNSRGVKYDTLLIIESDYFENSQKAGTYDIKYAYSYQGNVVYEIGIIEVIATGNVVDNHETPQEESRPNNETPQDVSKGDGNIDTNVQTVVSKSNETNDNYLYFLVIIPLVIGIVVYFIYRHKNRIVRE